MKFAYENFAITKFSSSHVEQNKASGRVMEKCGLHFVKYGEFHKLDGTCKMRSMEYEGEFDDAVYFEAAKKIDNKNCKLYGRNEK